MSVLIPFGVALLVVLLPDVAWAWGPFTHLDLARVLLGDPGVLPAQIAQILVQFPGHFYYGSIAADMVLAKNLASYLEHAHNWRNAFRLLEEAEEQEQRAYSFGYLTHLAADTVCHNYYIPMKLIESFPARFLRHSYWEMRFDQRCYSAVADVSARLRSSRFPDDDALHERLIRTTLFPRRVNRRIFGSVFVFQNLRRWRRAMEYMDRRSHWPLMAEEVSELRETSLHAMRNFLWRLQDSEVTLVDPRGIDAIQAAKGVRQELKRLVRRKVIGPQHQEVVSEYFRPSLRDAAQGTLVLPELTSLLTRIQEHPTSGEVAPPPRGPGRGKRLLQRALRKAGVRPRRASRRRGPDRPADGS